MFKDRLPRFPKDFKTNGKYDFDKDKNILSISEYCSIISKLPDQKKQEICDYLQNCLRDKMGVEFTVTVEDFLINKFMKALTAMAQEDSKDDVLIDIADNADIDLKKIRFKKYWSFIESCYKKTIGTKEEKIYGRAFNRLDQPERLHLQAFLHRQSEKILLTTDSPVEVIDILSKEIIKRANIGFLSEMQVENYLYYQLYMCKLMPNPEEVTV